MMPRDQLPKPTSDGAPGTPLPTEPVCPNCGHGPAVVFFPILTDGKPDGARKLVCLRCCPKWPHDSLPTEEVRHPLRFISVHAEAQL